MLLHSIQNYITHPVKPMSPLPPALILLAWASASTALAAQENPVVPTELPTIVVRDQAMPLTLDPRQQDTRYQVSGDALARATPAGGTQPYGMVADLPGVRTQLLDPYGLTSRIGGNKGMRVRGVAAWHGAVGTVDGLSLSNINPGPGYLQMFDQENLAGVSLIQGPVPPSQGGLFTASGALDSQLLWPRPTPSAQLATSSGDRHFLRSLLRVDSGNLDTHNTRIAASASDTHSQSWRGPGESSRENYLLALSTEAGPAQLRVLAVHSNLEQNAYRPLNASQALDLRSYQKLGYDPVPVAGSYQNYYRYNRQSFENQALIAELDLSLGADTRAFFKAFSFDESGSAFDAAGTNRVREWLIDHNAWGYSGRVETQLQNTRLNAGYSFTSLQPPGPPTAQRYYTASASGLNWTAATASSSNQGWTTLSQITQRHEFGILHLEGQQDLGALTINAGLRHFREQMPSLTEYNKTGVGQLNPAAAIAASSGPTVAVEGAAVQAWLPYLGLGYRIGPTLDARLAIGRNVGPASFDIWNSTIKTLKASQQPLAQRLWNQLQPELDNAIDLGLEFHTDQGYLAPTLYYSRIRHKAVNVYDASTGLSYGQNIGDGHQAGVQLAGAWQWQPALQVFGSAAWGRAVFDEDARTAANTVLAVKGQQFPDTPLFSATLGVDWAWHETHLRPLVRYQGGRYDDSTHSNRFGGYTTVDLDIRHAWRLGMGQLEAGLTALNLLDRRYLGLIDASDLQGSTTNYYPGNPRTLLARLSLRY
jgi:iron complex outermembrane recepter protein